jgi:hypothetical protein
VEGFLEREVGPSQDNPAGTYSFHTLITQLHTSRRERRRRRKMKRKRKIQR